MMKQKNRLQTAVIITYVAVLLSLLVFAVYMGCTEHSSVYQTRTTDQYNIVENYTATTVEDASAPVGIRKEYRWTLTGITTTKNCLAFYFVHHYAEVRIGGELVYSLTPGEHNRIGRSPGSNWVFIPLYLTDNGQEIQVTVTPVYKSIVDREITFELGARSAILISRLKADLPQILLSALCIFLGAALMIIQPCLIMRKKSASWDLFYLGNFLLILGIWRITDTRFSPIMFSENPMALGYITIAALFIGSAPLLLFIKDRFSGRKKALLLLNVLAVCITALFALICQVFQIAELRETLFLCHIMLLVSMAVILFICLIHYRRQEGQADLRGLVLLLCGGALMDLLFFYWKKSSSGIMFSVVALLIYTVVRFITDILKMNRKVYIDPQTGLFNKSRWDELMEDSAPVSHRTGVMMLDLNRLKYTNDTMGHKMGDKMIRCFADVLRQTLPTDWMICRWGGDEFTVLTSGADRDKMERYVSEISAAVDAYNASGEKPEIHFAAGYALSADFPTLSRKELMEKADEKMYQNKNAWYQEHALEHH